MKISKSSLPKGKQLYVAYPTYSKSPKEIIILANDACEARVKANAFFRHTILSVSPLEPTDDPTVFII